MLAIEADGVAYHSGHTARERDRLRQQLLERRGWVFHRIWSTDWFNDAAGEVAAVLAAFEQAVENSDTETKTSPADSEIEWELPVGQRAGARPPLRRGLPIDEYNMSDLVSMVRWLRSDEVVRSSDDELSMVMSELGFGRRGAKILRRISEAQSILNRSS